MLAHTSGLACVLRAGGGGEGEEGGEKRDESFKQY